jgi:ABC-2 type transport system permease protein
VTTARQFLALARRSILHTVRQPTALIPAMVFPLLFLGLFSSAMGEATNVPGFPPVESFLQFAVTTTVIQGALFGATAAGADMATDIEDGFFERLVASPVSRTSILVGRVAGGATLGFVQAWAFLGVASLFGLTVEGGFTAMAMVSVVAAVVAAGTGSLMTAFGLRTGSSEAVQGAFPLLFVLLFFSSAFFPRELMEEGWFRTVADINPMSHLIEGLRQQVIAGIDGAGFLTALSVAAGIFLIGVTVATMALRRRLAVGA